MHSKFDYKKASEQKTLQARVRDFMRVLFCVFWIFFAAEWCVRLLAPMPMLPRYVQAAPFGIRMNIPDREYNHRTPDYKIQIRTNSKGIRADYEIPYEKKDGTKRIVLLGDSFGMGYGVDLEDTFLLQMCQYLEAGGYQVEAVNLAVSGHGNAEGLIMLREEGIKFQPDLVVLAWHQTDYMDNVRSNLFVLKEDALVVRNREYLPGVKMRETLFRIPAYEWIATHSQLYALFREKAAKKVKAMLAELKQSPQQSVKDTDNRSERTVDTGNSSLLSPSQKLSLALIREIQQTAKSCGAEFLILDIPKRYSRTGFISVFPPVVDGIPALPVVSPVMAFKQHPGELLYWEHSHWHFTPLGTQLVGQELADYVLKHGLLGRFASDN